MTQEEEQLLIKDMCARLPYGVKGKTLGSETCTLLYIGKDGSVTADTYHCWIGSKQFVPYLRPMSSMTEEEKRDYDNIYVEEILSEVKDIWAIVVYVDDVPKYIDWLNAHHFDYHGLIEKGLALEAPEDMYKTE